MDDAESQRPGLLSRPLRRSELVALDCLAAAAYVGLFLGGFGTDAVGVSVSAPAWVQALLVTAGGLPVAARRLWPVPVLTAVLAVAVVSLALGMGRAWYVPAAFAAYTVAVTRPRRWPSATSTIGVISGVGLLAMTLVGAPGTWDGGPGQIVVGLLVLGAAWTLGRAVRDRRAYRARAAAQLADRAVAEERLRIARELHDVVAHSIGVIAVKAGVANHVLGQRPAEAHDALRVIETASRDALGEMRRMLGVLRSDSDGPDLDPAPGLPGLPGLAERAAMAGVRVDLDVRSGALPAGVELSVYRIVQEALTNVVKHAAPAGCRVTVTATREEVHVEVVDDGPGVRTLPARGAGHGLVGMRERVLMYGGTFAAGPCRPGGFAVTARIPLPPEASA
ncbi:sensor histidine kinase [Actinomycetes bacterium KLBMP 9797]